MKNLFLTITLFISVQLFAQTPSDSLFIRKIYDEALENGKCYDDLRELCKNIGARITGSAEAEMAIKWGEKKLKSYGFDKVYLQEIPIPHWERGTKEAAWIENEKGDFLKLDLIALGGSIGTNGILKAEVIEAKSLDYLKNLPADKVKGKIVFLSTPFDQKLIQTFKAYGACYPIRGDGAVEAAKKGAIGVVIRSLGSSEDDFPHTGTMHYEEGVTKIPAAAMSTNNANTLQKWLLQGKVTLSMELNCKWNEETTSYNVIAELKGKDDQIITIGGHLDSWDVGEGAHDDGAGIVHCIEALRILKTLGYQPQHTLRCVLYMNEENGNYGGETYALKASEKKEKHIAAIESDRGGFMPLGFDVDGTAEQIQQIQAFKTLLQPYNLFKFEKGYSGVDIRPLKKYYPGMVQLGMVITSQRYFDYHHTANDVFENVNKRELELGSAAMAGMLYLLDKYL
ncbi:MAG: M28 family peptidase [Vicingaceae bacterium]